MTKKKFPIECSHGLLFTTCVKCYEKSEKEVKEELSAMVLKTNKVKYDYQELNASDPNAEVDLAYDMDDSF